LIRQVLLDLSLPKCINLFCLKFSLLDFNFLFTTNFANMYIVHGVIVYDDDTM
jgi:hypothetical protein